MSLDDNPTQRSAGHVPREVSAGRADEVVDALCDAFHDYPVMRYAVGDAGADYDRRLNMLIGVFVARRIDHGHPILAIEKNGKVAGVATLTPPGDPGPPSAAFDARIEALWQDIGQDARERMEHLVGIWKRLTVPGPQYHLNMLGVRHAHAGQGLGRILLDEVHRISREHPDSTGVSLSTEDPKNVLLYEHCGYEVRFHERVSPALETWILFRPDDR
jgi:GNAT superfamily N-acetyltransferase